MNGFKTVNIIAFRAVYDTTPVKVEYSLTEYGRGLEKVFKELKSWGEEHREHIMG